MSSPLPTQTLQPPLIYLITSGETSALTASASDEFARVLLLVEAAVAAKVDLLQIREKQLNARTLYELSAAAARITKDSSTKLLINDRADIAAAAGADGVHLTTSSLPTRAVREAFGDEMLIGVSTHSLAEAIARRNGGDFVVYGPVFQTTSKQQYGAPLGIDKLAEVCAALAPFPVLALGGVSLMNIKDCMAAGASGIAAIGMFSDANRLGDVVNRIRGE